MNHQADHAPAHASHLIADLHEMAGVLRRGWALLLTSVAVCFVLMALYLARADKVYQGTTRLLVLQQGGRPLNVATNDPTRSVEGFDDYIPTHALLLSSPVVIQRAIDAAGLDSLPTLAKAAKAGLRPVDEAAANIKVTRPDRQAKILRVDYWSGSREESVTMLKAVTESYRQSLEETYQKKSSETISLIAKARDDLSVQLRDLEANYLEHRRKAAYVVDDAPGRSLIAERLERSALTLKEIEDRSRRLKFQLELGKRLAHEGMEMWAVAHAIDQLGGNSTSLNTAVTSGTSMSGNSDYVRQLKAEQQLLAEKYGVDNAKVQTIQEQLDRVRERVRESGGRMGQSEVNDLITSIGESLKAVEAMREDSVKQFAKEQSDTKQVQIDMLTGSNLHEQVERHRALFNTVLDQLKQAEFVSDLTSITSQVIETPYALTKPTSPRVTMSLALSMVVGLVGGVCWAFVAERMDPRVRTLKRLRTIIKLPVLTRVARVRPDQLVGGREVGLISESLPRSAWAESFRSARTNIDLIGRSRKVQVILVTSPYSGDGKSVSASNLAITLARAGRKTLLIDGDLRKPSLHKIHRLPNTRGLTDVLADRVPFVDACLPAAIANLDLLTAGTEVNDPAELLISPRLDQLLGFLRGRYDFVVMDSPPLLAVSDPAVLTAVTDGVVLVVRPSRLRQHDAESTMEWVKAFETSVLGMVVNVVKPEEGRYRYEGYGSGSGSTPSSGRFDLRRTVRGASNGWAVGPDGFSAGESANGAVSTMEPPARSSNGHVVPDDDGAGMSPP